MDNLAAKVQNMEKHGFTIGTRIFVDDYGIMSYSFDCNVGDKRYTDLTVSHGFSKDDISGYFRTVLGVLWSKPWWLTPQIGSWEVFGLKTFGKCF